MMAKIRSLSRLSGGGSLIDMSQAIYYVLLYCRWSRIGDRKLGSGGGVIIGLGKYSGNLQFWTPLNHVDSVGPILNLIRGDYTPRVISWGVFIDLCYVQWVAVFRWP